MRQHCPRSERTHKCPPIMGTPHTAQYAFWLTPSTHKAHPSLLSHEFTHLSQVMHTHSWHILKACSKTTYCLTQTMQITHKHRLYTCTLQYTLILHLCTTLKYTLSTHLQPSPPTLHIYEHNRHGECIQWVKALAAQSNGLRLISGTYVVKGENGFPQVPLNFNTQASGQVSLHVYANMHAHDTHTDTHTKDKDFHSALEGVKIQSK